jgi:hypothetical protein
MLAYVGPIVLIDCCCIQCCPCTRHIHVQCIDMCPKYKPRLSKLYSTNKKKVHLSVHSVSRKNNPTSYLCCLQKKIFFFFVLGRNRLRLGLPSQWHTVRAWLSLPSNVPCPQKPAPTCRKQKCPEIERLNSYNFPPPEEFWHGFPGSCRPCLPPRST